MLTNLDFLLDKIRSNVVRGLTGYGRIISFRVEKRSYPKTTVTNKNDSLSIKCISTKFYDNM